MRAQHRYPPPRKAIGRFGEPSFPSTFGRYGKEWYQSIGNTSASRYFSLISHRRIGTRNRISVLSSPDNAMTGLRSSIHFCCHSASLNRHRRKLSSTIRLAKTAKLPVRFRESDVYGQIITNQRIYQA